MAYKIIFSKRFIRHYLPDVIYGASDGIITTFSIVSGVEGAKLSPLIVIILGFANLFSDGISMAAASYLSFRANEDLKKITYSYLELFLHSLMTFLGFILCGAVPLISFLIPGFYNNQFLISCIMTALTLFLVGMLRTIFTEKNRLLGGLEMLIIGGLASIIGYIIGHILSSWC